MQKEFSFAYLANPANPADSMHMHAYSIEYSGEGARLELEERVSTDDAGMVRAFGLQAESNVELDKILTAISNKLSDRTLFVPIT